MEFGLHLSGEVLPYGVNGFILNDCSVSTVNTFILQRKTVECLKRRGSRQPDKSYSEVVASLVVT